MGLDVKVGVLGPVDIWKSKDEFIAREQASLEKWQKMSEEERGAVLEVIDRALDRLKDTLEQWVPGALKIENGRYIDVLFRVLFSELEDEVRVREEMTERVIRAAAEGTAKILNDLDNAKHADVVVSTAPQQSTVSVSWKNAVDSERANAIVKAHAQELVRALLDAGVTLDEQ